MSARTRRASARSFGSLAAASASRRSALLRLRRWAASRNASRIADESLCPSLRRTSRFCSERSSSRTRTVRAMCGLGTRNGYSLREARPVPTLHHRKRGQTWPSTLKWCCPRCCPRRLKMLICRQVRILPGAYHDGSRGAGPHGHVGRVFRRCPDARTDCSGCRRRRRARGRRLTTGRRVRVRVRARALRRDRATRSR